MVKTKKAIAMIELIFALVIMGIVLMSAPMLIQQSIKSGNVALQQEAIAVTSEKVSWVLSVPWDENSNDIITIDRTPLEAKPKGLLKSDGTDLVSLRSYTTDKNVSLFNTFGILDLNDSTFDDIDDFHENADGLILFGNETSSDIGDYVDNNVRITVSVSYAEDNSTSLIKNLNLNGAIYNNKNIGNIRSNIKFIKVNLTPNRKDIPELEKNITMEAFSCNIGTYSIEGRSL